MKIASRSAYAGSADDLECGVSVEKQNIKIGDRESYNKGESRIYFDAARARGLEMIRKERYSIGTGASLEVSLLKLAARSRGSAEGKRYTSSSLTFQDCHYNA